MPRYIDAEHLIQLINDNRELSKWGKGVAIACVMDTPVLDAVEVVRCKECMYRVEHPGCNGSICDYMEDDDFCSGGIRKRGA